MGDVLRVNTYTGESKNYIMKRIKEHVNQYNYVLKEKNFHVKEIRNRGYQKKNVSCRKGIIIDEDITYGECILELNGHISLRDEYVYKVDDVIQSYVFYSPEYNLVMECNSDMKYLRRSCRPNSILKVIFREELPFKKEVYSMANGDNCPLRSARFCVFPIRNISAGEEILLKFDYEDGNKFYRHNCACTNSEYCLNIDKG
jgi:hypothetical protein